MASRAEELADIPSERKRGLLSWMPPSAATFIYTVLLKPPLIRALAHRIIRLFIPKELAIDGVTLVLNQEDPVVSGTLTFGCYEPYNLKFFKSLLSPGMCVLDVGANIGLYSAVGAAAVGPGGRVIAVEPEPKNCSFIRRTIERNAFTNVTLAQRAAGATCGTVDLFLCETNKADHRVYDPSGTRQRVSVQMSTLDSLLEEFQQTSVDVIKIDTQGSEPLVIGGMTRILDANPSVQILMEFWPWGIRQIGASPQALLQTFIDRQFEIYEIDGDKGGLVKVSDIASLARLEKERHHVNVYMKRA